jgi:hypothetical protein
VIAGLRFFWGEAVQWLHGPADLVADGTPAERARFFNGLAWIAFFSSRLPESREAARRAEREAASAGDGWEKSYSLAMQAWGAALEGDARAARVLSPRAIRLAEETREPWLLALAHLPLVFASMREGDPAAARAEAGRVEANALRAGDIFLIRFAQTYVGFTHYLAGDLAAARRTFHPLAASLREISSLRAKAPMLEIAGLLAYEDSRPELAARLLGAADRLRELTGAPQLQPWHAPHERALASARRALGDVAFARAWHAGRRADADSALDLALEVLAIAPSEADHRSVANARLH